MKKTFLLIFTCSLFASLTLFGQSVTGKTHTSKIGITFSSLGRGDIMSFEKTIGGPGYFGGNYYAFGLTYLYKLNKVFDVETGIEYSRYKITITSNLPPQAEKITIIDHLPMINLPVSIRVNFLRFFFIDGGPQLDLDLSNSSYIDIQTGIGAHLGIGINYDFKSGVSVFANPYSEVHSILSFSADQNPQRIVESGFRFGLSYRLKAK